MRRTRFLIRLALLYFPCSAYSEGGSSTVSEVASAAFQSGSDAVLVRARAVSGDAQAQYELGSLYFFGQQVKQDDAQAFQWFQRAAEQGRADAQNFLAMMYRDGRGVTLNFVQAAAWARRSAEQGHARGQALLGIMSFDGHGVSKDTIEGYKWESLALARTTEEDMKTFASNALRIMTSTMSKEEIAKAEMRASAWVSARQTQEDTVREAALRMFCGHVGNEIYFVKVEDGPPSPTLLDRLRGDPRFRSVVEAKKEKQNPFGVPARGSIIHIGALEWQSDRKALLRLGTYHGPLDAYAETLLAERDSAGHWSVTVVPGSQVVS